MNATPLIEYRFDWISSHEYEKWKEKYKTQALDCDSRSPLEGKNYSYLEINIKNLSDKQLLKKVSIAFGLPPDSKNAIAGSQLLSESPALKGDNVENCGKNFAQIADLTFHPDWEYILLLAFEKREKPYVVLLGADQAILLKEGNYKTWVVRNEGLIVLFSIIIGFFVAVIYLYELGKKTKN